MKDQTGNVPHIDCLQTAFSLKIRLVLISASAIARTTLRYNKGLVSSLLFFLLWLTLSFIAARGFAARMLGFFRAVTLQQLATLMNIPLLTKDTSDHKHPPSPPHLYHVLKWIRILSLVPSLHTTQRGLYRGQSSSLTSYPIILFHASSRFDLCFKIRGARLRVKDEITEDN